MRSQQSVTRQAHLVCVCVCVCQLPCAQLDQFSSTTTDLEKAEKALPALLSIDSLIKTSTVCSNSKDTG